MFKKRIAALLLLACLFLAGCSSNTESETMSPDELMPVKTATTSQDTGNQNTGVYVGSINSDKYHLPSCRWAQKIKPGNEIWFDTKEEAEEGGYSPCKVCKP